MGLEYTFLFVTVIANITLMFMVFQKDNLLLMMDLLETRDPEKWMNIKYFKPILVWTLISTMCIFYFCGYIFNKNGWL